MNALKVTIESNMQLVFTLTPFHCNCSLVHCLFWWNCYNIAKSL